MQIWIIVDVPVTVNNSKFVCYGSQTAWIVFFSSQNVYFYNLGLKPSLQNKSVFKNHKSCLSNSVFVSTLNKGKTTVESKVLVET